MKNVNNGKVYSTETAREIDSYSNMKRYYMMIPLDIDKQKNTRFVVETYGVPTTDLFTGRVVARNKKAYWYLGQESDRWVNPVSDLKNGWKPSFLPINMNEAKERFDEHCIED